jgi:hypothetical protein
VASAGDYHALYHLQQVFEKGLVSRDAMDSLTSYNSSCQYEKRSKRRVYSSLDGETMNIIQEIWHEQTNEHVCLTKP